MSDDRTTDAQQPICTIACRVCVVVHIGAARNASRAHHPPALQAHPAPLVAGGGDEVETVGGGRLRCKLHLACMGGSRRGRQRLPAQGTISEDTLLHHGRSSSAISTHDQESKGDGIRDARHPARPWSCILVERDAVTPRDASFGNSPLTRAREKVTASAVSAVTRHASPDGFAVSCQPLSAVGFGGYLHFSCKSSCCQPQGRL